MASRSFKADFRRWMTVGKILELVLLVEVIWHDNHRDIGLSSPLSVQSSTGRSALPIASGPAL